ncbi:hypothetical protein [Aporhodopirellula aestuarii]|uniref:Uncharacterized protein n=1 Tax=Aporhodopirellula aestuarii TaxID=2950107 RepID=A0ABT0UDX2_9BACT|nr:hypothetical protein [Aporhodopirellula aestuarii]MCM2375120.1 hypothetical protein [Aporhodopirellula aestuarii]
MFSKQFSIRAALLATFVVAVAWFFVPTLHRRIKFADQYNALKNNAWRRSQGTADGHEFFAPNGTLLSVWTTEHEYVEESGYIEAKHYTPDPTRFYVVPPGKWVDTVDEVLETWDLYD